MDAALQNNANGQRAGEMRDAGMALRRPSSWLAAALLIAIVGAFIAPRAPFSIDGGVYHDMARAMANDGALFIAENGGVDGAPPLTKMLTLARDGKVYPQYPSGYAFLAAPFYEALGIPGLMLMNALCAVLCVWLTARIGARLGDERTGVAAALIFTLATFMPVYAFAIWPHMLALAFGLGATYAAILGVCEWPQDQRAAPFLISGLLVGAGFNIRIDLILAAVALIAWLRVFAVPSQRLPAIIFIVGFAPGLVVAAAINQVKFGAFSPFSYGRPADGAVDDLRQYLPLLFAATGIVAAALLINLRDAFEQIRQRTEPSICIAFLIALAAAAAVFAHEFVYRLVYGVYVLVINLQAHNAYEQVRVDLNEYGQLMFWGYPKKSLIQSLPYLPLIFLPIAAFVRGENHRALGLSLLAGSAPIAFYALNQWHGGASYNLRYFMPALPFLSILSAIGMQEIVERSAPIDRRDALIALVGAAVFYLALQEVGQASDRLYAPAALYPQWFVGGALAVAVIVFLIRPNWRAGAFAARNLAIFALAFAAAISFGDEAAHEKSRDEQQTIAADASRPIAPGSLVLTQFPLTFLPAESNGAFVMLADSANADSAAQAASAFRNAGRCVYIHDLLTRGEIGDALGARLSPNMLYAPSAKYAGDKRLRFSIFISQAKQCSF